MHRRGLTLIHGSTKPKGKSLDKLPGKMLCVITAYSISKINCYNKYIVIQE